MKYYCELLGLFTHYDVLSEFKAYIRLDVFGGRFYSVFKVMVMDKNIKKGFTLVELAIVLVVIGILLGLVLKGKSIIDAANSRAETTKLSRIKTAVQSYFTKYDRLPGITSLSEGAKFSSKNVYDALIDDELLSPKDFVGLDDTYWAFIGCRTVDGTGNNNKRWVNSPIQNQANLCVYLTGTPPETITNTDATMKDNKFDGSFICQIESSLDDMNSYNGMGRLLNDEAVTTGVGKKEYTCNDADVKNQSYVKYLYKVK